MKHLVQIPLASALLGAVFVINGCPLDAVSVLSILFCSCLVSWMLAQYRTAPRNVKAPQPDVVTQPERPIAPAPQAAVERRPAGPDPVLVPFPAGSLADNLHPTAAAA